MYAETIPALSKMLSNLERWLDDAVEVAEARGFDPDVLLACRLAPDMFTLTRQIQAACDSAKFIAARLGGVDAPSDPDSETTLAEVRARIARTREFVASVPEAGFVESGSRELVLPFLQGGSVTVSRVTLPTAPTASTTTGIHPTSLALTRDALSSTS
ncbi:MAG: hypothetical protein ACI9K2_001683, partial [Myxococcota bacterium]